MIPFSGTTPITPKLNVHVEDVENTKSKVLNLVTKTWTEYINENKMKARKWHQRVVQAFWNSNFEN